MRLNPLVRLTVLAAAIGLAACDPGTTNGDGSSAKVSFTLPVSFAGGGTVAAQTAESGDDIDRIDVSIVVKSSGESVLQRTLREGDAEIEAGDNEDPEVTLNFRIPQGGESEVFTLTMHAMLGSTRIFTIGPADFTLGSDGRTATVIAEAQYVGPGSNVTGVLLSPRSITVGVNQTANFSCVGTPGNVTNFLYQVETANPSVASVQNTTTLRGVNPGTTDLVCRLGFGARAEDRVTVTVTGTQTQNGILNGVVRNGQGTGLPGATLELRAGTGVTTGPVLQTKSSQADGSFTFGELQPGAYTVRANAIGFADGSSNVTVVGGQTANVNITLTASVATGSVTGAVTNATTGLPIPNVVVEVRAGTNNTTGTLAASGSTNSGGQYTLSNLAAGPYTIRVAQTGFAVFTQNITVTASQTLTVGISLVATAQAPQVQIVLNWGGSPADLDAHLYTPSGTHISWRNVGNCSTVCLDNDVTTSGGPETITIASRESGTYLFHVHNWTVSCGGSGTDISASGATVRVYFNGVLQTTITPPAGPGTNWGVFQMNGTTITPVNFLQPGLPSGESCTAAGGGTTAGKGPR